MTEPLFLLGDARSSPFRRLGSDVLRSIDAVREAYARHGRARWIVLDADALGLLASAVHGHDRWHRLLLLERASTARRELLHALFRVVVESACDDVAGALAELDGFVIAFDVLIDRSMVRRSRRAVAATLSARVVNHRACLDSGRRGRIDGL